MSKPKIAVVIGSTRAARFADIPAGWIAKIAKSHADIDVEVVDLRDFPMPFFDEVASSAWAPSQNEVALRWQKKVAEFDGFIFTAAEYNHGPTAVLKNAIDYAANEWNKKPAARVPSSSCGCMPSSCRWRRSSPPSTFRGATSSPSGKVRRNSKRSST
jgi:NAD(P)H-dependent FMN reductase